MTLSAPRRDALLRLLEDWEAGRMTPHRFLPPDMLAIWDEGLIAHGARAHYTLTPAGLSAARQARGEEGDG